MRAALRSRTAEAHQQLESRLAGFSWLESIEEYAAMLERLWGFYATVEPALRVAAGAAADDLLRGRAKLPLLAADLATLGRSEPELDRLPRADGIPPLSGVPGVLGALYVLEGATLGGKVIEREVSRRLGLGRRSGTSFFGAYGSDVARRWRQLGEIIEHAGRAGGTEAMLETATRTFAALDRWLTA